MTPVTVSEGMSPVVMAFPHSGTFLPDAVARSLNAEGRALRDTDWHLPDLYADLLPEATWVQAHVHRYAIDNNRDPAGQSLYPGQATTGLVPETDFDGTPIVDQPVHADDQAARLADCHAVYHGALSEQIARVKAVHGHVVLYDCHSIRSVIPRLFDGVLPDFNIGTYDGTTCAPGIEAGIAGICQQAEGFSTVTNARFKGGWTTRHYGKPAVHVHAVQMELAQSTHLVTEAAPWRLDPEKTPALRAVLRDILTFLHRWRPDDGRRT